jgi:hypothetical protein
MPFYLNFCPWLLSTRELTSSPLTSNCTKSTVVSCGSVTVYTCSFASPISSNSILGRKMKSLKLLGLATFVIHVPSRAFTVLDTRDQHGNAAIIIDNPAGVTYRALLPDSPTSRIRGSISGTSSPDGIGVQFIINLSGLPGQSEGPLGRPTLPSPSPYTWLIACRDRPDLAYHVHDQPLGTDGNCAAALAHHDPYRRSEKPLCDPSHPATCQVGDLSGKHGNITGSSYSTK